MLLPLDNFAADVQEWDLEGFTQATLEKLPRDKVHVFHSEALDVNLESDSLDESNLESDYLAGSVGPDGDLDVSELEWRTGADLVRDVFENRSTAQTIGSNVGHNAKYSNKNNVNTSRKFTTRHHDRGGEGTTTGQEGGEKIGYNTIELRWRRMTLRVWHRQSWGLLSSLVKVIKTPEGRRRRVLQGMKEIDPSATSTRSRVQNEFLPKALAKLSKMELTEWAETFGVVGASSMSSADLKDALYAIPSGVKARGTKIIPPSRTKGTTLAKYLPQDKNGRTVISLEAGFEYVEKIH